MGVASAEVNGYVSLSAPLDCKYIVARTLFEFGKLDQAIIELEELKKDAKNNKSVLFYVLAETFAIRILTAQSKVAEALEQLNNLHLEIDPIAKQNDLAWLIDVTELYIRFILGDTARAQVLIERSPDLPYVRHVKAALAENAGMKTATKDEVLKFSEKTFKEQIYKYLYLAEFKAEGGTGPKDWMKKALEIGEITGCREMFIRQGNHHIDLIIELAKDQPSMYLEELARECIKRLNQRTEANLANSENLTSREVDVLKHLATGKSIEAIGNIQEYDENALAKYLPQT
jgi:ATP/maltotriose-dependent transcriptional regulator MalT